MFERRQAFTLAAWLAAAGRYRRHPLRIVVCPHCDQRFTTHVPCKLYCSDSCRRAGRRTAQPGQCGTVGGYYGHRRRDEPVCDPCRQAHRAYGRMWRAEQAERKAQQLITPPERGPADRVLSTPGPAVETAQTLDREGSAAR